MTESTNLGTNLEMRVVTCKKKSSIAPHRYRQIKHKLEYKYKTFPT